MRETLSKIYFDKTKDVMNSLRQMVPIDENKQRMLANELGARLGSKKIAPAAPE